MKLNLGVWDVAYSDPDVKGATTTGQVAEILESEYEVMGVFFEKYREQIGDEVVNAMTDMLEARLQGAPAVPLDNLPIRKIDKLFQDYLSRDEWQQHTGQEIMAAKEGIRHRFKNPAGRTVGTSTIVKKGDAKGLKVVRIIARAPRPAFIDTGLYQASFTAWLHK